MRRACIKAGTKLGVGLALVIVVIGIRLITATPDGVEAEIEELSRVEAELAASASESERAAGASAPSDANDSIVSRLSAGVREQLGGSKGSDPDAERLVSCRLPSGSQFMRAADCAVRGGESTAL